MISSSWNCRGIGNPQTVQVFHNLVQRHNPSTVFLMETKVGVKRMVKVKERIGLPNGLIIPSEGRSGGMALLWVRDLDVEIRSFSRYHIDAIVINSKSGFKWRMTGFYGNPETSLRKESWSLLRQIRGPDRAQQQMEGFREVIDTCGFQDMGFEGPEFTWCNQRLNKGRIQLRLDKVLASVEWAENYQNARVYHIVEPTSDHCAILLTDQQHPAIQRQKRFHFEEAWTKYEKCKEVIQEAWINYSSTQSTVGLVEGLTECAAGLSR
ncbi:uncharacterized protein LOC115964782 [Quercus lobata]|uniref:uncharacterized protein LOC115964782 n=1 Tax=Quercus lobata TaxID=97700 RepID=UPI00124737BA|nr:uncharacterized protein LOC115964782 [Quercus lobata]